MESRTCYRSLAELPGPPDAAFVAISRHETIDVVRELARMGTGGVVCYASGFAEVGGKGSQYQSELDLAKGQMPLIGPNCYGVLNYQDGVALWPDEQGGQRCKRGVAIISQSGNITVSLTMQRRGVPVAFLFSTGNMTGVKKHDYIYAMLDNPDITAIGLYLEGVVDAQAFSRAAIEALKKRVPIVVLESGRSERGAKVTRTHSYSLSSDSVLSSAFYKRYGIIQVQSIPELLETLKLVSILTPEDNHQIASISCSGGEAALMADLAAEYGLEFSEFSDEQSQNLSQVLGNRVVVSNPLDYHTYIWGDQSAQTACFRAVYEGSQNMTLNIIDFPTEGICDPREWDFAVNAIIDARNQAGSRVAAVATLHENFPPAYQTVMLDHQIAPMLGTKECIAAIASSVSFAKRASCAQSIEPLRESCIFDGGELMLTEFQAKQQLHQAGLPVVQGALVESREAAIQAAHQLTYPVVAKASSAELIHKSDVGGVVLNINCASELENAIQKLSKLTSEFLLERQVPPPLLELLVGYRMDATFGPIVVVGAGGRLANLIEDSAVLYLPVSETELADSLSQLKIGQLLNGYRGVKCDLSAVIEFISKLTSHCLAANSRISELEVNPLYVYGPNEGVIAVDVVCRIHRD